MAERIRGPRGIVGVRRRLVERSTRLLQRRIARYFRELAGRISVTVKARGDAGIDWPSEKAELRRILRAHYLTVAEETFGVVSVQVGAEIAFDLNSRGVQAILRDVGARIMEINEVSRDRVRAMVLESVQGDANADTLEKRLRSLVRSWAGLEGPVSMSEEDRRRLSPVERAARSRAHAIALTESGNAYNRASVEAYRESGLVTQVRVYDGADCGWTEHDDPDLAEGSTRTLNEAALHPLSHPHCQRAFGPQVQRTAR